MTFTLDDIPSRWWEDSSWRGRSPASPGPPRPLVPPRVGQEQDSFLKEGTSQRSPPRLPSEN